MEEIKKEKEQLDTKKAENLKKLKEAEQKLIEAKEANKLVYGFKGIYEEEVRQKRLGPDSLDPAEVYESLPEELQKCFDARDVKLLQETICKMAKYHIKRCVDSGLWVPQGPEGTQDPKEDKNE
ncbi:unnamed protein product [Ceutorhynchus assimilis]|uniref:Cdc37 C-terminal domain-containing protein n=1 Tax=Ceutorhynchus assimilis TaxID=467358 RepID=A0A9N9MES8_9CUCU|nr:unnamed protein product [Ceutorhynchus assimilis]